MKLPRRALRAEIPTVPAADIAFLLMVLYLVSALFSASRGLEYRLPAARELPEEGGTEATLIRVNADGSLLLDCRPVQVGELLDRLAPDPDKPLILYTDPYATYSMMIAVYDALAGAQRERGFEIRSILIPTQSDIEKYIERYGGNPFETPCRG